MYLTGFADEAAVSIDDQIRATSRTEARRWTEVRDEDALWGDLRPELLETVKTILEATMEDELTAQVLADRYQRTHVRLDHRNGFYRRTLVTELGASPTRRSRGAG